MGQPQTTNGWSNNVDQSDTQGWDDDQNPETNNRRWEKRGGYNDQNRNRDNNDDNSNQNNQEWSYL